jgi:hypothetical protein
LLDVVDRRGTRFAVDDEVQPVTSGCRRVGGGKIMGD